MQTKPRVKLSTAKAAPGEIVTVEAFISHPMEPGGAQAARNMLSYAVCTVNKKRVFEADLEAAISANPYLQFNFRATELGVVHMTWRGDDGSLITGEANIIVK